jgi:hypothetical protein
MDQLQRERFDEIAVLLRKWIDQTNAALDDPATSLQSTPESVWASMATGDCAYAFHALQERMPADLRVHLDVVLHWALCGIIREILPLVEQDTGAPETFYAVLKDLGYTPYTWTPGDQSLVDGGATWVIGADGTITPYRGNGSDDANQ